MNKIKIIWKLSSMEILHLIRSTKIIILALFAIFVNIQIIAPLRALSISMEDKLSVFEPFTAIGNSGLVVLILPIFFMTMMADFPREGESLRFYQIRCSKRTWIAAQILYAIESSVLLTVFVFVVSVLLSFDFTRWKTDYSSAITGYVAQFPERAGEYVVQLIPENLYNQISLPEAVVHTGILLCLYFTLLAMVILLFSIANKKIAGIFWDGFLILFGTISCAGRMTYMWIMPMAHTIIWLHYTEYQDQPVFLLGHSYLYFGVINIILIVLALAMSKKYNAI